MKKEMEEVFKFHNEKIKTITSQQEPVANVGLYAFLVQNSDKVFYSRKGFTQEYLDEWLKQVSYVKHPKEINPYIVDYIPFIKKETKKGDL